MIDQVPYVVYEAATGRIIQFGRCPEGDVELQGQDEGLAVLMAAQPLDTDYVLGSVIVARPALPARLDRSSIVADDTDVATLSGLPVPCVVEVNGQSVQVPDGVLALHSAEPGRFALAIDLWPFLPWSADIEAVAP